MGKYVFFILRVEYFLITFSSKPRDGAFDETAFLGILKLSDRTKDESCVSLTA